MGAATAVLGITSLGLSSGTAFADSGPSSANTADSGGLFSELNVGLNQNAHFANKTQQDIYVLPAPDADYLLADMGIDVGLAFVGATEVKAGLGALEGVETLKTFGDLYKFMKHSGTVLSGTAANGFRTGEAALAGAELVNHFKEHAIKIPDGQSKNVMDKGFLSTWTNPASGWGGMVGGKSASFIVMTGDGKKIKQFDAAPDDSWIATPDGIVRSKYGTLWQEDPQAGRYSWDVRGTDESRQATGGGRQKRECRNADKRQQPSDAGQSRAGGQTPAETPAEAPEETATGGKAFAEATPGERPPAGTAANGQTPVGTS